MSWSYIEKLGCEMEGSYLRIDDKPSSLVKWVSDESISRIRHTRNGTNFAFIGEAVSIPLDTIEKVKSWINIFTPDRKNSSCGVHVHCSFLQPAYYYYLLNEDFYIKFYRWNEKIGKQLDLSAQFWERLKGSNYTAQKVFKGWEQIKATTKNNSRYAHLNYCYQLHGTIENRVLPAIIPVHKACQYVEGYTEFIEDYLEKHEKPEITKYNWESEFCIEDN